MTDFIDFNDDALVDGPSTANVEEETSSENGDMNDGSSFRSGKFVLVSTGKRNRNYISQVIAIVNSEFEINYLQKKSCFKQI